jgi:uncharacterized protein YkwD
MALLALMAAPAPAAARHRVRRNATTAPRVPRSCPGADLQPSDRDLGSVRIATLCLVNRERVDRGEQPLVANVQLERAAQAHTESMAFGNYFEDVGPQGQTPLSRAHISGWKVAYEVGENIGWGTLWKATPSSIVAAWMASPGHRANILDDRFRYTAVGVSAHPPASLACGQPGGIYTQDFIG